MLAGGTGSGDVEAVVLGGLEMGGGWCEGWVGDVVDEGSGEDC